MTMQIMHGGVYGNCNKLPIIFSGYNLARIALKEKRYNAVIDECNRELADDNSVYQLEALLLRATFALISGSSDRAAADFDQFFRHFNCLPADKREQQTKVCVLFLQSEELP
jgi:hypothetical protein